MNHRLKKVCGTTGNCRLSSEGKAYADDMPFRTGYGVIHERSCGAIVLHTEDGLLYVLLVQHCPGHWSFPKGHMEQGESEHETAIREVQEETGVEIEIIPGFRGESTYSPKPGREKTVTFFLGNYRGGRIRPQEEEVREVRWMRPDEAVHLLTFDRDQSIFLEALEHYFRHGDGETVYPPASSAPQPHDKARLCGASLPEDHSPGGRPEPFSLKEHYSVDELLRIMAFLRSDAGCPWDRIQTHESIQGNFLEEAYEAVDAIQQKDAEKLCEELGDVMMQVVFHAQIAAEAGEFAFEDVVSGICRKLICRHSHLFGDDIATTPEEVLKTWEKNKRAEKGFDGIVQELKDVPKAMPALTRSFKLQKRAARVGFDWPTVEGARTKMMEEMQELFAEVDDARRMPPHSEADQARRNDSQERIAEEAGDLLFAVVNVLRMLHVDPEAALNNASGKFIRRMTKMDEMARAAGARLEGMTLEAMDQLWNQAKAGENS